MSPIPHQLRQAAALLADDLLTVRQRLDPAMRHDPHYRAALVEIGEGVRDLLDLAGAMERQSADAPAADLQGSCSMSAG